ncbi:hypothetical protein KAX29_04630 [candidate division WOR-3 bacterium]|nr:hypothetical protein [candidate division WOR-3 bacterium]
MKTEIEFENDRKEKIRKMFMKNTALNQRSINSQLGNIVNIANNFYGL